METTVIERNIWIAAPPEQVWQAITEPDQIAQWFLPGALGAQMQRDSTGKLTVMMGPMGVDIAMLDMVDPPRRAITRSLPDNQLTTTFALEAKDDGTRLTVTITGFEALPARTRKDRITPTSRAWEMALENVKAFIEGDELPHPEGLVASLYGYRREATDTLAIERTIWIAAPVERVWRAITDPAQIEQWFSPGTQWRSSGTHVGARLSVYNPETDSDMYVQVLQEYDPPHRLVTRTEDEPPYFTTWSLFAENGGTRLNLSYSGYEHAPVDTRHNDIEQNAFGFGMMLQNLKAAVEGSDLPFPGGF